MFLLIDPNVSPVYSGFGLPIMPSITPGIAVTGVLLMLAGLPYCLVGIKQKKLAPNFCVEDFDTNSSMTGFKYSSR